MSHPNPEWWWWWWWSWRRNVSYMCTKLCPWCIKKREKGHYLYYCLTSHVCCCVMMMMMNVNLNVLDIILCCPWHHPVLSLISSCAVLDIILCCPWYHPVLSLISSCAVLDIILCCPWYHPVLSLISSCAVLDIILCCPRYHPVLSLISSCAVLDIILCCPWYHPVHRFQHWNLGCLAIKRTTTATWTARSTTTYSRRPTCIWRRSYRGSSKNRPSTSSGSVSFPINWPF